MAKDSTDVETIPCPFCSEDDFDLIGLKGHLERGDCQPYETIVPSATTTAAQGPGLSETARGNLAALWRNRKP